MKELVGRSRNERKLDGIYNKQREALLQQYRNQRERNNDIYANLNKRKANETIPFPEIYEKKRKSDKLKEVEISKNSKNKRGDNVKGEEQTKQLDNANEKNKRMEVFLRNYIHDDDGHTTTHNIYTVYSEDELHIKCMVSLFDKVINKIIDNRFQINTNTSKSDEAGNNDMQSTNMDGKMKEPLNRDGVIEATQCNDEEGIPNRAPPQGTPQSKTVDLTKQEKKYLKALKIKVYYLIILYKLNDNFIFNKLISIYRQIWEELLTEYEHFDEAVCEERRKKPAPGGENTTLSEGDDMTTSDAADSAHELADDENFLHLQDKWTLPDDYELFKIKRSAFVKCMSKVFNFIHVKWASTLVESLLLDVYFKRHIFDTCDEIVIEKLQSAAKVNMNKRKISTHSPHVLSIGESLNPVVDARAEKIVSLHGSHVWSTKQMER